MSAPIGPVGTYAISLPAPGPAGGAAPSMTNSNGDATIIALIAGTGGADIVIPGDTIYIIDAPIVVPSGKTLRAANGTSVTLKAANGYSGYILSLSGAVGSSVKNITIDGNYANRAAVEGNQSSSAIAVSGGVGNTIEHVKILNAPSFGVWAYNSSGLTVRYSQFNEVYHAIRIDGNDLSNSGAVTGNTFLNTAAFKSIQSLEAVYTNGLTVMHNTFQGVALLEPTSHGFEGTWGNAIYIFNSDDYRIENNTCNQSYWSSVVSGQSGTNGVITRNYLTRGVTSNAAVWIEQLGADYVTLDANTISGGVSVGDTGGDHLTITNNFIDTDGVGIDVNMSCRTALVQHNTITRRSGSNSGIFLWEKHPAPIDVQVLDNEFIGFTNGVFINNGGGVGTVYGLTVLRNYFGSCATNILIPGGIVVDVSCDIQTASAAGPFGSTPISLALTGNAAATAVGSVTPRKTLVMTGVSGVGAVGTVAASGATAAPTTTLALTGVAAAVAVGSVTPGVAHALSGVSGAGAVGAVAADGAHAFTPPPEVMHIGVGGITRARVSITTSTRQLPAIQILT